MDSRLPQESVKHSGAPVDVSRKRYRSIGNAARALGVNGSVATGTAPERHHRVIGGSQGSDAQS